MPTKTQVPSGIMPAVMANGHLLPRGLSSFLAAALWVRSVFHVEPEVPGSSSFSLELGK